MRATIAALIVLTMSCHHPSGRKSPAVEPPTPTEPRLPVSTEARPLLPPIQPIWEGADRPPSDGPAALIKAVDHAQQGDWRAVEGELVPLVEQLADSNRTDVAAQAHVLLARAFSNNGKADQAQREHKRARQLYAQLEARALAATDSQRARRLGRVLMAVGESLYRAAEAVRQDLALFDTPKAPAGDSMVFTTAMTRWIRNKHERVLLAERLYQKIAELEPEPPQRWNAAAQIAAARMWANLLDAPRAAPYPRVWDRRGFSTRPKPVSEPEWLWAEVRAQHFATIDKALVDVKRAAKRAHLRCVETALEYQQLDHNLRACISWLVRRYPVEHPAIEEMLFSPTAVPTTYSDRFQAAPDPAE